MSSPYYCSPPFHCDPGITQATATTFYLVTSPQARAPGPGVYPSWASAKRVAEKVSRGGGEKLPTYAACIPAWHACCDAGEHSHPACPKPAQELPSLRTPPASAPQTPRHPPSTPTTTTASSITTPSPASSESWFAAPRAALVTPLSYAVRGGGVVHSSLDPALKQYEEQQQRTGHASLATTPDTRYAAHFAAGHNRRDAKRLADGERLAAAWRNCDPADTEQMAAIQQKLAAWAIHRPLRAPTSVALTRVTESLKKFSLDAAMQQGLAADESDEYYLGGNISSGDEFDEAAHGE